MSMRSSAGVADKIPPLAHISVCLCPPGGQYIEASSNDPLRVGSLMPTDCRYSFESVNEV